jgi:DNA-binding NarL/FixJ family response regulator
MRDALRRAVLARERFRTGRKIARDQALWPALVAGRWSLIDAFSASGTRYIIAYENPPGSANLRALSTREQTVLEHVLGGRSGKWIGLELGLSEPTVTRTTSAALRRLGVANVAELTAARTAMFESLESIDEPVRIAVARSTQPDLAAARLTLAEHQVARAMQNGQRVAAIARERGTSAWTVAHQVASIYQKLGVSSRREFIAQFDSRITAGQRIGFCA